MSRVITRVFQSADGLQKVEIYKRPDGTFGFEVLKFGQQERSWFPSGKHSYGIFQFEEDAIREAKERVSWFEGN